MLEGTDGRTTAMGYQSSTPDTFEPKFTSQTREPETVMDWFNVRDYDPAQGRFQSVDPGNAGADPSDPQTWNMYAYVTNNPLSYTDPSGLGPEGLGLCSEGPVGCVVGIGSTLLNFLGIFGGGGHTPSLANISFPNQFPTAGPSGGPFGPGNDQGSGSGSGTGGLFGSGNTGPFVSSFGDATDEQAWEQISFFCHYYNIGCSAAEIAIKKAHPFGLVLRGEIPIAEAELVGAKTFDLILRDATGRVHLKIIPKFIAKNVTREQLELAAQELRGSIQVRIQNMIRLGEKGNHGPRIAEEQGLLYQIEKRLGLK